MIGYDLDNQYGGNGIPIQAFIYTMYNSATGKPFPTYCSDIHITAVQGANYRRLNLEDSSFSAHAAGMIRAILENGFYITPIDGETEADHAARVSAKTAELVAASGAEGLTTGEAIAATQAAIWKTSHGAEISFPKFCRYVFSPTNTKYVSLCSYNDLKSKDNALINSTIETVCNYLQVIRPLSNITFDIYPVATKEEYATGAVLLPEAKDYQHPALAEYSLVTDQNGHASMNFLHHNLPGGVYLVVERSHPSIVSPIEPFYLHIPMIDSDSGELVYEITMKPKNEVRGGVHIEKDVISVGNDEASVDAYEAHTWIIGSTVPEDLATGESYVITDVLDNRLDYLGNVTVVLEKNGEGEVLTLTADTDYKVTVTDVDSLSEQKPSDSFTVALTAGGMSKIANAVGSNNFNSYMLRVRFDAQINANAQMGAQIPNQAEIAYTNAVNFEFTDKSDIPVVYTGGINLLKVSAQDKSEVLPGAVFEVYRTATQEEVGAGDPGLTEIPGVVGKVMKVSFFDNSALQGEKVTSVTSDEDGKVAIYGLAYGKYFLVETEAPAGYLRLDKTVELTVNQASHSDESIIIIENKSGVALPSTGGMGTTVFMAGGICLMCMAGFLLCITRRRAVR